MFHLNALSLSSPFAFYQEFKEQPDFLPNGTLHPHQMEGLNWLVYSWHVGNNVILADEMGFVKRIFFLNLKSYKNSQRCV